MEAAGLEARPVVEEADDLTPVVRVGARGLARAGVADPRLAAIPGESPLAVVLVRPEVLALGALPRVEVAVIAKAGGPVALRAAVRVAGEDVQRRRRAEQEERVATKHDHLRVQLAHGLPSGTPAGSVISVKRISGSVSVTRGTVWRTPSQQR